MNTSLDIPKPLLSVIIPCYNCAPVITRCLDSIDYKDCEIIVVNDGSTDATKEVVEKYASVRRNVRIITKSQGGVSSARNEGIRHASGKYISYIDADDYIVSGGLERIVQIAEQYDADVVKFKWRTVTDNDEIDKASVVEYPIQTEQTTARDVLKRHDISDFIVWDGVYRRSVIIDNGIAFKEDLQLHEDDVFMGMLYCHADKVIATDLPLYRYVAASNYSSTHRQTIDKQRKLIMSGLKAVGYRKDYVGKYYPQVLPMERLKYMRWVCLLREAIRAEMNYKEYVHLLRSFQKKGVYPLDYHWIEIAGWDKWSRPWIKRLIQTFMVNHLYIGWPLAKIYYKYRI